MQHGYFIDNGKALEIRPLSARLRQLLRPQNSTVAADGAFLVGAHIFKPVLKALDPSSFHFFLTSF